MKKRSFLRSLLVSGVVVAMQLLALPVMADDSSATLSGTILYASDDAPVAGAKLHVGDPQTGRIYTSDITGKNGAFKVDALPASTYELAVESGEGLFVVGSPLSLAPGQSQSLNLAVNESATQNNAMAPDPKSASQAAAKAASGFWNNPMTAALIVLGSAVVLGVAIDEATDDDDEPNTSPSSTS